MNDRPNEPTGNRQPQGQLVPAAQSLPAIRDAYGPLGYPGAVAEAQEQSGWLNLLEYWRILKKRKWLILGIAAAFVTLAAIRTLMQIPLYTATVRLQIEQSAAKIVKGDSVMPSESSDDEFMRTQFELLQGRTMAARVASSLKLGEDSDFLKPREFSILGALRQVSSARSSDGQDASALESAAVDVALGNIAVQPVVGSRLVDLSYTDPSAKRAQEIANAYADAYLASNLDKQFQANASAKTFLEDKINQLKLRLEESEKRQLAFAQEQQIVDVNDKTSIAENNLAAANAALGNLISERTKNEQQWRQVEAAEAINLPQLLSNNVIVNLRDKRKSLEIQYQQKLEVFKPAYPEMVQIQNQIDEIDRQLAAEVQTIKDSLQAAYQSSLANEEAMKNRIETLRHDVLDLQKRSIQYNILKREVDTNRELYTSLLQRYKEVDVASGVGANNVFVVESALLPGAPSSPRLFHALQIALALGLAAGFGVAFILERLDDKIRSVEQLESISSLSTLGVIPNSDVDQEFADPRSALWEAYRSLCTALQFATDNGLPKTITFTSSGPAEGKSLTSTAIAKHFANLGRKVLLIDADLRNPSLHVKLGSDNSVGLSNYLTGSCSPPDVMQKTEIPNLAFIASGPLPPNAADLLGGPRLLSLLSIGSEVFDLIVIDGPPVLGLADAQLLSSVAAATVFVVAAGSTRKGLAKAALRRLQMSRAAVIGVVLTKYDAKSAGYGDGYGYGYGYAYGNAYGQNHAHGSDPNAKEPSASKSSTSKPQLADLRARLANIRKSA